MTIPAFYHCLTVNRIAWAVLFLFTIQFGQAQLQAPSPRFGGTTQRVEGPNQEDGVSLQFPDNPIDDILAIYERLIEKPIVKDSSVREGPNVSLVTPNDVSKSEAVRLIEATLLVNGYVLANDPDNKSVTVLRGGDRAGGQSPAFSEGILIYTDPLMIPQGDALVGFFMTLDYISPEDAATIFENHITFNDFGKLTPVSTPRGLLITETSPIVRALIQLRTIIDRPVEQAPLLTEFVPLEHAEANIVAQIIQAAMDARMVERERQQELQARSQTGNQQQQGGNQQRQQAQRGGGTADRRMTGIGTADQPAAQLIPDDRLNRIMVVASPSDAAYILELIREFDQPLDTPEPCERSLQYVKANDILPVIVDILQDTGTGETQLPGGRQIDTRPQPVTSSQLATLTGTTSNAQNNQNRTNNQEAEDVVGGRQDQIAFPVDDIAPISVLVGKTRIIADRQSNSIIIIGGKQSQKVVCDMIDRLDRKPVQVYLATVIGEMTLDDDVEFGIDYLQRYDSPDPVNGFAGGLFGRRTDVVTNNNITDLSSMVTTNPFGPVNGLNLYGHLNSDLDSVLTALEETNRFKVLSRPVVYTQNGKRAEITSGQEVPVPVDTLTDTNNINAVQTSIDFKEVVLKLEVLPTINEKDEVTLDIVQINDRVIGNQIVANNNVPIIGKQELNTTVSVANRSTIVLGGLISESLQKEEAGIPVISRIPVLGHAAKNSRTEKTRTELMIFIQPVVVHCDQENVEVSYDEDVRSQIGKDAVRIFPGPGVPTLEHRKVVADEVYMKDKPIQRLGQRIFGKKKKPAVMQLPERSPVLPPQPDYSRAPLPIVAEPVYPQ